MPLPWLLLPQGMSAFSVRTFNGMGRLEMAAKRCVLPAALTCLSVGRVGNGIFASGRAGPRKMGSVARVNA